MLNLFLFMDALVSEVLATEKPVVPLPWLELSRSYILGLSTFSPFTAVSSSTLGRGPESDTRRSNGEDDGEGRGMCSLRRA